MLSADLFQTIIKHAPLFAKDFVVINEDDEILVGKRLNAPAKEWWFVPGGRVFKNEPLSVAFKRLSEMELGIQLEIKQAFLLGLFDHFYEDSSFSGSVSTHYINATHVARIDKCSIGFPSEQHSNYRWVPVASLHQDITVHKYSKVFLPALMNWIKKENIND